MERRFAVKTGELVSFEYELAGVGTRFLALLLDSFIQGVTLMLLGFIVLLVFTAMSSLKVMGAISQVSAPAMALALFIVFCIIFGYFIIFEIAWRGQTIGKRVFGIRVVRDGGQRCDAVTIVIRNLVRMLEAALGFYFVSAIVTLISPENKRLGDYAAGTIVIRDHRRSLEPSYMPANTDETA